MNIEYSKITDNPRVIELLKQRTEIENKIKAIDETALIKHELELLSLPDVVVPKGTLCCPECKSTDLKVAIHTDYNECNKCYHYWET
jgi:hypothetical protein